MMVGSSVADPFILSEYTWLANQNHDNYGNNNITNKTPVRLSTITNNCVLVGFGDSLGVNIVPTAYTPVNSNVLNFNIYNGGTYSAIDPVLGASGPFSNSLFGCMFTRLADKVQGTGVFTNTILIPASIGGTLLSQWQLDSFNRIKTTFARLAAAGLTATAVCIQLGANDTQAGTTQAAYTNMQAGMIALIRLYYAGPIFIAIESWISGGTSAAVQAAQAAAVNHPANIWAGPNTDTITNTGRQGDQTHWNDAGSATCASLWLSALQAHGAPFG